MSQPYVGEIRCFGFTFAPMNWAKCDGRLLDISQFNTLYAVIGTTYGGNGTTNFAVPNLQGRVPMHWGTSAAGGTTVIGQIQGTESVTLTAGQIPAHSHTITVADAGSGTANQKFPQPNPQSYLGPSAPGGIYNDAPTLNAQFSQSTIGLAPGGSLPHENRQPFLGMFFAISLFGIFPARN